MTSAASVSRSVSAGQTLGELGEFGLIRAVSELAAAGGAPGGSPGGAPGSGVIVGPGDDAALVAVGGGEVLVCIDVAVEGRHFRRDWSSGADVGHRIAGANMADIAAMGGTPRALVVALSAPAALPAQWALELTAGLVDEAALAGARLVGGDVAEADMVSVAVTALGAAEHRVVRRDGSRPGDVVAIAGRIGWAAAGLAVLSRGFRSPKVVVEAHRRPQPPYAQGPAAAVAGASAMIDVSDGLLADLGHIAEASGVAIDLRSSAFTLAEPLQAVGAALGADPLRFCLTGGDDHALVATFSQQASLPQGWTVIGQVADGSGVTVDGADYDADGGHRHFS